MLRTESNISEGLNLLGLFASEMEAMSDGVENTIANIGLGLGSNKKTDELIEMLKDLTLFQMMLAHKNFQMWHLWDNFSKNSLFLLQLYIL